MAERIVEVVRDAGVPEHKIRSTLAQVCGISPQAIKDWVEGKTKNIKHAHLVAICKKWGISLDWLISGKGQRLRAEDFNSRQDYGEPDRFRSHEKYIELGISEQQPKEIVIEQIVAIPRYRIALAAGPGNMVQHEESDSHLHFQNSWLKKKRLPIKKLKALDVSGDSMEPRVSSGDVVLINTGDTTIKDNCIYAIRYGDSVKIKRLSVRFDGAVILTSDNPNAKGPVEEAVSKEDLNHLQIIGRAVWVGGDL